MAEQQQLPLPGTDDEGELFSLLVGIADRIGRKEFAFRLDLSESAANHALNRTRRGDGRLVATIPIEKILLATLLPGGDELLAFMARRSGMELVVERPPSIEEEHTALMQVLQETLGGELRKGLLRAKQERLRANRGVLRVAK